MNNNLDPKGIRANVEDGQSRLYDDGFKNIEDKKSSFQENMINYYNKKDSIEENKAKKEELTNEISNKTTGMFSKFFNSEKIKDENDFKDRCANASKVTILMIVTCALFFLNFKNSLGIDIVTNFISLILFGYSCIALKKGDIKGVYTGLVGGAFCILSFNIIKIALGGAYILGMLYLLGKDKTNDNDNKIGQ